MAGVFSFIASLEAIATCAKIISIVLLTLGSTQAAPTSDDLWSNPCSNHQVRHTRSTAEKELRFFINTLNKERFKEIKALYPQDLKKIKGNCPRLQRLLKPIEDKRTNSTKAHQLFYKSMIKIAKFIDKLQNMNIKTNTKFDIEKRRKIYENTQNTLRLTICEFNETIMNKFKSPEPLEEPHFNTACLPEQADLSRVQMLDIQFFQQLKKFFKRGKKCLRQKKNNEKSRGKVKGRAHRRTKS